MLAGDTTPSAAITDNSTSLLEQVKLKAVEIAKSFTIDMWLARITPDKVMPILLKVIEAAKYQYAEAVKHGDGIYAVGYCVGGRFVMLLGKETKKPSTDEEAGSTKTGPYIRAGAVAHAASVIPDDFQDIKAPLSFACVEDDPLFPDELRSAGEDKMTDAGLEHEVQVYPRVPHGK
jgi:dienelactone hydrolase